MVSVSQRLLCDPGSQLLEDKNTSLFSDEGPLTSDVEVLHSDCANALLVSSLIPEYHQCRHTPWVAPVITIPWFVER